MKGRAIHYNTGEMAWLEVNRAMVISDYHRAFCAAFDRDDVSEVILHSRSYLALTPEAERVEDWPHRLLREGAGSWNKGKECAPGTGGRHPNSRRTQFKGGVRQGVAVKLYKPIGTERLSKEGYLERKIHDGMPLQSRWRAVHLVNWEAAHGPIPKSHCLKCLDGDRLNTDPLNWELAHRGVLARLNGGLFRKTVPYDAADPELKPTIMAIAKLKHRAGEAKARK